MPSFDRSWVGFVLVATAAACGSPTTPDAGDASPTVDATPGPDSALDAAVGTDAQPGDDVPAAMEAATDVPAAGDASDAAHGGGPYSGIVFVMQDYQSASFHMHTLLPQLGFVDNLDFGTSATPLEILDNTTQGCTHRTDGACVVTTCGPATMPPSGHPASAGAVTISGGMGAPIVLSPSSMNAYTGMFTTSAMPRYAAGDMVAISGAGATVPAFSGSVAFPDTVTVTAPSSASGAILFDHTMPLQFAWTGGGSSTVRIELGQYRMVGMQQVLSTAIRCAFPASGGSASVPASSLAGLDTSNAVDIWVSTAAQSTVTAGAYTVDLAASEISVHTAGVAE